MKKFISEYGYTLIEMMVTLAVVTLLAGVSLPWYGDYTRKAQVSAGLVQIRSTQIRTAELVFLGEADEGMEQESLPLESLQGPERFFSYRRNYMPVTPPRVAVWENYDNTSTDLVKSVVRSGTVVVVSYTTKIDKLKTKEYFIVYYGQVEESGIQWECRIDQSAKAMGNKLRQAGAPVGDLPMPAEIAPSNCIS